MLDNFVLPLVLLAAPAARPIRSNLTDSVRANTLAIWGR